MQATKHYCERDHAVYARDSFCLRCARETWQPRHGAPLLPACADDVTFSHILVRLPPSVLLHACGLVARRWYVAARYYVVRFVARAELGPAALRDLHLHALTALDLSCNTDISEAFVMTRAHYPRLRCLRLSALSHPAWVRDAPQTQTPFLAGLAHLTLDEDHRGPPKVWTPAVNALLAAVAPTLRHLHLRGACAAVSPDLLGEMAALEILRLDGVCFPGMASLSFLRPLTRLRRLEVRDTAFQLTAADLQTFTRLRRLTVQGRLALEDLQRPAGPDALGPPALRPPLPPLEQLHLIRARGAADVAWLGAPALAALTALRALTVPDCLADDAWPAIEALVERGRLTALVVQMVETDDRFATPHNYYCDAAFWRALRTWPALCPCPPIRPGVRARCGGTACPGWPLCLQCRRCMRHCACRLFVGVYADTDEID